MYLTLRNDEKYQNNTNSDFIYQLDDPLVFNTPHEVALVECYFNYDYHKNYGQLNWYTYQSAKDLQNFQNSPIN